MKIARKLSTIAAIIAVCAVLPFGTMAAGAGGSRLSNALAIAEQRNQVRTLNSQIISVKKSLAADIAEIAKDMAGVKQDAVLAGGSDYQTVKKNLESVKTLVGQANEIDYKSALRAAKGSPSGAGDTLSDVIAKMTQKQGLLNQAETLAQQTKMLADSLDEQKQADRSAYAAFVRQANTLKLTIDGNYTTIHTINAADASALNQIVATVSANKDVLKKSSSLKPIEAQMETVKKQLSSEYNGKVAEATKQYESDRKGKNYDNAIKTLNEVIEIQTGRIATLQGVQTDLGKVLSDLDALVAAGASS